MSTVEERVATLEARLDQHARGLAELRGVVVHLEQRMDRRFEAVDARFADLENKMDRRFDAVERRIDRLTAIQLASMTAMIVALAGVILKF